eukprot:TRINITY_DN6235_c0_g1_i1.p1 TRINITY_DN6235_c0_g1~~TRINITY_DN6235_c0_g1_i1.p1  ORF type:complete len:520 (-),score=148.07 TRINITY_DN6235_c0_g1_i1:513-2072(-)
MMHTKLTRQFSTTVAVLAGNKSQDIIGARIIRSLQKLSKEKLVFVGVGGEEMRKAGLEKSYGDINTFVDKPFMAYKNFLRAHVEQPFHPLMAKYHWQNRKVLQQLDKSGFYDDIGRLKPSLFLTIGNEYFMVKLYQALHAVYRDNDTLKPPMFYYDRLVIHQKKAYEDYLDHFLYTIPREPINWEYYKFPSTYVGSYAAGRVVDYLYRNSEKLRPFAQDNKIYIAKESHAQVIENLVNQERSRFREKRGIHETATVIYANLGQSDKEINWFVDLVRKSINEFLARYSKSGDIPARLVSPENFVLVLASGGKAEHLRSLQFPVKTVVVEGDNDRFSAIAASDIGIVPNGELVEECAAAQLPTMIIDNLSHIHSYYMLLYNSFNNDLNIAIKGEGYPEITNGEISPYKVSIVLKQFFENPKLKFTFIQRYEKLMSNLHPEVTDQLRSSESEKNQLDAPDGLSLTPCYHTNYLAASKILEAVEAYAGSEKNPAATKIDSVRSQMLSQINPDKNTEPVAQPAI